MMMTMMMMMMMLMMTTTPVMTVTIVLVVVMLILLINILTDIDDDAVEGSKPTQSWRTPEALTHAFAVKCCVCLRQKLLRGIFGISVVSPKCVCSCRRCCRSAYVTRVILSSGTERSGQRAATDAAFS